MFLLRKSAGKRPSMSDKSCVFPPAHLTNGFAPLANVINTSCLGNANFLHRYIKEVAVSHTPYYGWCSTSTHLIAAKVTNNAKIKAAYQYYFTKDDACLVLK